MFEFLISNGISDRNKLRENWFIKNKPELYKEIIQFKKFLNIDTTQKFSQIVYHFKINLLDYPICEYCQKPNTRFIGFDSGYMNGCNKHCAIQLSRPKGVETRKNNTFEKYGVEHTTQLKSVQEKMKKTTLERFGVEFAIQNNDIKQKMYNIMEEKYGCKTPLQNTDIKDKMLNNFIDKYGVDNPMKSKEFIEELRLKNLEKYGYEWKISTPEVRKTIDESNYDYNSKNIIEKYSDLPKLKFIKYENNLLTYLCEKCNEEFNITTNLIYQRYIKHKIDICLNCNKLNNNITQGHRDIIEIITAKNLEIVINDRKLINPYELDIFCPKINLAIEFNGLFYHSTKEKYDIGKEKDYHIDKKKKCLEKNIDLIYVWGDDWELKKDLVKSIINNRLGLTTKIGARKCILKEVNKKESKEFLEINHIQGDCIESKRYGLYYNDELVSLATFKLMKKNTNIYELKRFCNKQGISVIGGLSRLFKHFIREVNPLEIISFCDNDYFKGNIYYSIGMTLVEDFIPNYWWSNGLERFDRRNFTKKKLVNMGEDINLTEVSIMEGKGWLKYHGSGNKKFIWKK
jgi:hypothetical protein